MACSARPDNGWSVTIQRLLRLHTLTSLQRTPNARTRHPAGKIWRSILAQSIFADLSLGLTVGRRFVRLEYLGLSGVILYELPDAGRLDAGALTLREVFGADDDPEDLGMEVDHLLDRVGARLIYAPAYACTSFVVGQVMNALLHSQQMRPIATTHGILVDAAAFTLFDAVKGGARAPYTPKPTIDVLSILKRPGTTRPAPGDGDGEPLSDAEQEQDFDTSVSTIDSVGPYTPPQSRSGTPAIVASDGLPSSFEDGILSERTDFLGGVSKTAQLH